MTEAALQAKGELLLYVPMILKRKFDVNTPWGNQALQISDCADGCNGALLAFRTRAEARKWSGLGDENILVFKLPPLPEDV